MIQLSSGDHPIDISYSRVIYGQATAVEVAPQEAATEEEEEPKETLVRSAPPSSVLCATFLTWVPQVKPSQEDTKEVAEAASPVVSDCVLYH